VEHLEPAQRVFGERAAAIATELNPFPPSQPELFKIRRPSFPFRSRNPTDNTTGYPTTTNKSGTDNLGAPQTGIDYIRQWKFTI